MTTKPTTQIAAYSQNVPAALRASLIGLNVSVSPKHYTQSEATATDIAVPRTRSGNISLSTTHVIGASVIA